MVSIKDVARLAGVSDKTVSRVVNKEPSVKAATKEKVKKAIADLGYVPNMGARLMRNNRSHLIGIITDFISTTPYSGDIIRGIQSWADKNGKTVLITNTDGDIEKESKALRTFKEHRLEGVLYVTMYHREASLPTEVNIPCVFLNCRDKNKLYPSVAPDDYAGASALTQYIIDKGHKRIGYIRLNPILLGAEERYKAFRDITCQNKISADALSVKTGMSGEVGNEENTSFQVAMDMLSSQQPPTAIMCGNDEIALQVLQAALTLGLRVPKDIAITGFDDFEVISKAAKPALTTAALHYFELGKRGAERLGKLMKGEPINQHLLSLECKLIKRESA
ncbi:MAG: LacI family DNA-binding transcriptional regulator [Alphaproteobacteria bacterium]